MPISNTIILCILIVCILLVIWFVLYKKYKAFQKQMITDIEMFKKAFDISEDAIMILSGDNKIYYTNRALQSLFSFQNHSMGQLPDPIPRIKIDQEWVPFDQFLRNLLAQQQTEKMHRFTHTSLSIKPDDPSIPVNLYVGRSEVDDRNRYHIVAIHDLSQEYDCSETAYRHPLTKIPNQLQAKTDLSKLFSKIHLHHKKLALMLVEIDNMSQIRAMIGYEKSENILIKFAQYLEKFAQDNTFYVYHMFSDTFLLCLPVIVETDEAVSAARALQKELRSLYRINGVPFHLTASIGICVYPDSSTTMTLLDNAYKALNEAKKQGYGHIYLYTQTEFEKRYDEIELFNTVHEAIGNHEFEIYYQPIVRAANSEIVEAEALIRWKHPTQGYIPPDIFIPILEKSGFIVDLGRYVFTEVLKQQKRWELFKFKPITVSINTSILEIEAEGFVENIAEQLSIYQISPEYLRIEITQGAVIQNETLVERKLLALKKQGISITIDDFGTGYNSSFLHIKKFSAQTLKIDKSLVEHILDSKDDRLLVKSMIELGHKLGMKIVVEGIHNRNIAELIASYGCDYLQGYYFGKPQPAYEFQELIRR